MDPSDTVPPEPVLVDFSLEDDDDEDQAVVGWWTQMKKIAVHQRQDRPGPGGSRPGRAPNIDRDFVGGHRRLLLDYFWPADQVRDDGSGVKGPVYSEEHFERRFRMPRSVFEKLLTTATENDSYFVQKVDAVGRQGLSGLQKTISALRQLAYGVGGDATDEYCRLSESTANDCLKHFCAVVVRRLGTEFLRQPTEEDAVKICQQFENAGFPGCIGAVDCAGWDWAMCPTALHGTHKGKSGLELRMEVVAD